MRRFLALCAVLGLAACGSVTTANNADSAEPGGPPASTRLQSAIPERMGFPDRTNPGLVVGETFTTHTGNYHRLRLDPDHRVLNEIPVVHADDESWVDHDGIRDAVTTAAVFAVEELATSQLAFDYSSSNAVQWWEDNADRFDPAVRPEIKRQFLMSGDDSRALLYTNKGWARGTAITTARVSNLDITLTNLEVGPDVVTPTFKVAFTAPVGSLLDADGIFLERTVLSVTYDMTRSETDWLIAGYETTWRSTYRVPDRPEYADYESQLLARR